MKFIRYQATPHLEVTSLHIDICEAWIQLEQGGDEEDIFDLYYETLSLRSSISADELFELIKECKSLTEAEELTEKYPLQGVCCYSTDTLEVDWAGSNVACDNTYAVVFEGDYVGSCGDGDIAVPTSLVRVERREAN